MKKKVLFAVAALLGSAGLFGLYNLVNRDAELAIREPLMNKNPLLPAQGGRSIASAPQHHRHKRRKNTILIKLKAEASTEQLQDLQELYKELDLRHEKSLLKGQVVRLRISNKNHSDQEEDIASQLQATGAVDFVEPDYAIPPAVTPNDSLFSYQWHHSKIQSPLAWNYTTGSSSVLVAVCDAGFDLTHPDLAPHLSLPGYNTVKDNGSIDNINDHGTMTAGTLAAIGNNQIGVAGLAWQVRILPIQISDQPDGVSTYSDVAECIQYAMDHGAKVVNLSYDSAYTSALVSDAALAMRKAGGLVVVAGGNSAIDISGWGSSPQLLVVGATDSQDKLTWFSNFGTPIDLYAPGQDIYSTIRGASYAFVSGTSFATPVVAGTVALLYSLNPSFTAEQTESFITSTLANVGLSAGRLNTGSALQKASLFGQTLTLDNLAPGAKDGSRSFTGKWCTSAQNGSYGVKSLISCGSSTDAYRFRPKILRTGSYNVSIRYLSKSTLSNRAAILIKHVSGQLKKTVNMQINGSKWVPLGTYKFQAGSDQFIELSDSAGAVNIDAVQFEPL